MAHLEPTVSFPFNMRPLSAQGCNIFLLPLILFLGSQHFILVLIGFIFNVCLL